jgi:two-component system sensor histidine kinase HydH
VALFSETDTACERTIRCGNGIQREVSITLSTTYAQDATVESRTAVIKDLTEKRRLEREAQRKEKLTAMGELAAGVAHEIRNPLNAVNMIAQRFEKEFRPRDDEDEYRSLARVLRSEAQRVNGIVQQFLRFARPPKMSVQDISTGGLVQHLTTLFESQARSKSVALSVTCSDNTTLHIDREQMTQAFLNVLQNALHATSAGGRIDLGCVRTKDALKFTITDSGNGIPAEHLTKIFNLYFTTKTDGTGMGLAITQQIIAQHNGTIEVTSEIGKGTTFTILLPIKPDPFH